MPALQNLVHVCPVEAAGIQAGPLIGHGDGLVLEAHFKPALGVALLSGSEVPPSDLEHLHELSQPGRTDILGLDEGRGLLNAVNAPLGPGVGLLLNGPKTGVPVASPAAGPVLAVAHQHLDDLHRHIEIPDKAQQDLQFLGVQVPAQQPLDLSVEPPEGGIGVHGGKHIPLRVVRPFSWGNAHCPLLRPQAQLPQGSRGAAEPGGPQVQVLPGPVRVVAAGDIKVQQRRVGAGRP